MYISTYNLQEAAKFVGEKEESLDHLAKNRVIKGQYFRGTWVFTEIELLKLLAGSNFYLKEKKEK